MITERKIFMIIVIVIPCIVILSGVVYMVYRNINYEENNTETSRVKNYNNKSLRVWECTLREEILKIIYIN